MVEIEDRVSGTQVRALMETFDNEGLLEIDSHLSVKCTPYPMEHLIDWSLIGRGHICFYL